MSIYYKHMIEKIKTDFKKSDSKDLENFLKNSIKLYQDEFNLPTDLMLLNISKILEDEGIESRYFKEALARASSDDFN